MPAPKRFFISVHYLLHKKVIVSVNSKWEINRCYSKVFNGKKPDLKNPKNLIEKIYWMELNTDTTLWTKCADKYRMREYIEECGYSEYLPKLYAKWDNADDIDITNLPNEFVLKANDGCGTVYIVKDKDKENIANVRKMAKQWMRMPHFGYMNAQLHYLPIESCIIAEELLHQSEDLNKISPESIVDFKFWCFSGEVESILVTYNRRKNGLSIDLYDSEWNDLKHNIPLEIHYECNRKGKFPKPSCLDKMLEISRALSKPFPEVRVDFYVIDNKPIIGELTFSTGYGYFTEEYYQYLGEKTDLTKMKIKKK